MTCKQLGGACDLEFNANTFEELAAISKVHGMEMFQKNDAVHLEAMSKMKEIMQTPDGFGKWMEKKRKAFEALPENE